MTIYDVALKSKMILLTNIYNRLNTYRDHAQFANYIADRVAKKSNDLVSDAELNKVLTTLRATINMNILLQRYNDAILAVKQHKIPFAPVYLAEFDLAMGANFDNINSTMVTLKDAIKSIANEIN